MSPSCSAEIWTCWKSLPHLRQAQHRAMNLVGQHVDDGFFHYSHCFYREKK
jgi:hypothetical protein